MSVPDSLLSYLLCTTCMGVVKTAAPVLLEYRELDLYKLCFINVNVERLLIGFLEGLIGFLEELILHHHNTTCQIRTISGGIEETSLFVHNKQ